MTHRFQNRSQGATGERSAVARRKGGYTLVFTLAVIALLAGLATMLAGPSSAQARRVDLHYRRVQADCLSLAGIESARSWAARGIVTNELYVLANGTVDTHMEPIGGKQCRVVSVGRVHEPWRKALVESRNETILSLP